MVRCVRYAFANIPPRIGRVFFAREVALPFLWFRLLRHGYLGSPIHWWEHREVAVLYLVPVFCTDRAAARISWHLVEQRSRGKA